MSVAPSPAVPMLIGPEQAALMARPVSIIVGSCDAAQRPHVMRAVGSRLSADRRRVSVLMPLDSGAQVLADLRANGRIAVVFTEPSSHLTLQLKGVDAEVLDACAAEDQALAQRYLQGFTEEIGRMGFGAEVAQTLLARARGLATISFSVSEAFEQTPGPAAGQPLPARRD